MAKARSITLTQRRIDIRSMLISHNAILRTFSAVLLTVLAFAAFLPIASVAANQTSTEPLYISFLPSNTIHATYGQTITVTIIGQNKGPGVFTVTGCLLWYHLGTSGSWKSISCFPTYHGYPIIVPAHSTGVKIVPSVKDKINYHLTFQYKLEAKGTYGNIPAVSYPGILTVDVS